MSESAKQPNTGKTVTAYARGLHIAPRKMRLVTNLIKHMPVEAAMAELKHLNKKGAPMVFKLIKSAVANAEHNFNLDPSSLYIKNVTCDMGESMNRYFPRARGSAFVIRRKMCHVNLVLEERKTGKKAASRFAFTRKEDKKDEKPKAAEPETLAASKEPQDAKKTRPVKTSEQVKMNQIQQKRRLFNRKSGE